jgi:Na+-driven multidrug efflux pump
MGIKGAAIATILAQAVVLCWQLWQFSRQRELLHLEWRYLIPARHIVKDIVSIGISPFAMQLTGCVVAIFMNNALMTYGGDLAVGAYSIANRLGFIFFMVIMGICQGFQPIAGYNYGARNMDRLKKTIRFGMMVTGGTGAFLLMALSLFAHPIVSGFLKDEALIKMGVHMLRFQLLGMPLMGICLIFICTFQSTGKALSAFILSACRQGVVYLPVIIICNLILGVEGVIISQALSDVFTTVAAFTIFGLGLRKEIY